MTQARPVPHGTLRITTPRLFAYAFLTPIVAEYLRRWPSVRVELRLEERKVDLVEEGVDLAIRVGALDDVAMIGRRIGSGQSIFVASTAYLAANGTPQAPEDLDEHELIVVTNTPVTYWPYRLGDRMDRRLVEGRFVVNSLVVARDMCLYDRGIAWIPRFLVQGMLRAGLLHEVLAEHTPPALPFTALYPSNRHLSAKVRAFLDLLIERLEPDATHLQGEDGGPPAPPHS